MVFKGFPGRKVARKIILDPLRGTSPLGSGVKEFPSNDLKELYSESQGQSEWLSCPKRGHVGQQPAPVGASEKREALSSGCLVSGQNPPGWPGLGGRRKITARGEHGMKEAASLYIQGLMSSAPARCVWWNMGPAFLVHTQGRTGPASVHSDHTPRGHPSVDGKLRQFRAPIGPHQPPEKTLVGPGVGCPSIPSSFQLSGKTVDLPV